MEFGSVGAYVRHVPRASGKDARREGPVPDLISSSSACDRALNPKPETLNPKPLGQSCRTSYQFSKPKPATQKS